MEFSKFARRICEFVNNSVMGRLGHCHTPAFLYLQSLTTLPRPLTTPSSCCFVSPCSTAAPALRLIRHDCSTESAMLYRQVFGQLRAARKAHVYYRGQAVRDGSRGFAFKAAPHPGEGEATSVSAASVPLADRAPQDLHIPVLAEEVAEVSPTCMHANT